LAYILAEIGKHHPQVIRELVCVSCKIDRSSLRAPILVPEYSFHGRYGIRRADLALYASADDEEPIVLIEVKYRDKLIEATEKNPAQIEDYEYWCKVKPNRKCLVLSRETLRLKGASTLTWTEAARLLRKHTKTSDLARALIEHLEEEGIVMQTVDSKALIGFLKRLLCGRQGAGQQAGNLDGPHEFSKLLRNVKLLSARFNGDFKEAWKDAGEKFANGSDPLGTKDATIDFDVIPRVRVDSNLAKMVSPRDGSLDARVQNGGRVDVWARHSLGSGKGWLRVGYGFSMHIEKASSHEKYHLPEVYLYAWASSAELCGASEVLEESKLSSFFVITDKAELSIDKLELQTNKLLQKVLLRVPKESKTLSPKQKYAIKLLQKSVGGKLPSKERD
jgi:hypothetical protein